jgi:hypothetical protein
VVQVIVADVAEMLLELTALIVGTGTVVENMKFADVAGPAEFADIAA